MKDNMHKPLVVIFIGLLLCILIGKVSAQKENVTDCLDNMPEEWVNEGYYINNDAVSFLSDLEGINAWIGYPQGIRNYDPTMQPEFVLYAESGAVIEIYSRNPEIAIIMVYTSIIPYADRDGEHWGKHPCNVFTVDSRDVAWLYWLIELSKP